MLRLSVERVSQPPNFPHKCSSYMSTACAPSVRWNRGGFAVMEWGRLFFHLVDWLCFSYGPPRSCEILVFCVFHEAGGISFSSPSRLMIFTSHSCPILFFLFRFVWEWEWRFTHTHIHTLASCHSCHFAVCCLRCVFLCICCHFSFYKRQNKSLSHGNA